MFEALPRLAVLEASGVAYDRLIVPEDLSSFHLETLELVGVARERLLPFTGAHLAPDELVWASPLAPIGWPSREMIRWLRTRLGAPLDEAGAPRRLYLRRRGSRRVVNERAVTAVLGERGFEVLDPDGLTFREQVAVFAGAEALVGPHGAAFSNGIFSRRLAALELYQPRHVNVSTVGVLSAAGHDHWSLVGRRVPAATRTAHHNVHVPIDQLVATLDAMAL